MTGFIDDGRTAGDDGAGPSSAAAMPAATDGAPISARTDGQSSADHDVVPVAPQLTDVPHLLLDRLVGKFLPPEERNAGRMACVNRDLSRVMQPRALFEKLLAILQAPQPAGETGARIAAVAGEALALPEFMRLQVGQRLTEAMQELAVEDIPGALQGCAALRSLIDSFRHDDKRVSLILAHAGMLGSTKLQRIGGHREDGAAVHVSLRRAYQEFMHACEAFIDTHAASSRAAGGPRAEIAGALARSVYCVGPQETRPAIWHWLIARTDCGSGDLRLPILTGAAAAVHRLPVGARRDAAYGALRAQLDGLSAPSQATLMQDLARLLRLAGTVRDRAGGFDRLHAFGRRLPQPERAIAHAALIEALECQPPARRQQLYDGFAAELPACALAGRAAMIAALASVNEALPLLERRTAAIDALLDESAGLAPELKVSAGVKLIGAVGALPREAHRQLYFEKALVFVQAMPHGLRHPMLVGLVDAAASMHGTGGRVAATLEVAALVAEQPQDGRVGLLGALYDNLPDEDESEALSALLSGFGRVSARLTPDEQVTLAGEAARACMWLEDAYLPLQFRQLLARLDALPEISRSMAHEEVAGALARAVDSLSGIDEFMLPDSYDHLLDVCMLMPPVQRAGLMEQLCIALQYFGDDAIDAATDRYAARIMQLPEAERAPLEALLPRV